MTPIRVYIYALKDPRTNAVRYISRTINTLRRRLREHVTTALRDKLKDKRKKEGIAELLALGLEPIIELLEETDGDHFKKAEKQWIAYYRSNSTLLNVKSGGDGALGGHFVEWTPELDARLGKEADSIIAESMGVSRKTVTYRREKLGIAASFDRTRNTPPPPMGGHNKIEFTPEQVKMLGTMPDYKLAKIIGVEKACVARRRNKLGIKSFTATTGQNGQFSKGHYPSRWLKQ